MTDHRDHHRRQDDERIAEVVRLALGQHFSVKKNGDTWAQYLGKVVTPDRLLLAAVLVFQFGGQFQQARAQLDGLVTDRQDVATQLAGARELLEKQQAAQSQQAATLNLLRSQTDALMAESEKFRVLSTRLADQVRGSVTRNEFNTTVQQQLLPRLERIERTIGSK